MGTSEVIKTWLHENWILLAIVIIILLASLWRAIDSVRDSVLKISEQSERTRQSAERLSNFNYKLLSSIDDNLRRIEERMARPEKRREERERQREEREWPAPGFVDTHLS
jgi:sensor histidine kinase YesM